MYPHERSLVKHLKDKPFVLLGINSDKDREDLIEKMEKLKITWPSFWNGGSTSGPISTKWNVRGWPTVYVIDAKGVIRYRDVRGEKMDDAVLRLLEEMGEKVDKHVVDDPLKAEQDGKKDDKKSAEKA